jgi:RNA polymerase sigma-70 factor (ECF subfamily)
MLRDRSQLEDALQTAVMLAHSQFDRYAEGRNFRAWMFRFVTLETFNRNRKHCPESWAELFLDRASDAPEIPFVDDVADLLDRPHRLMDHLDDLVVEALDELPPGERTVLLLRAIGEFSYHEMHQILAIPLGSVMGYLSRARLKLRQSLASYAIDQGVVRRSVSEEKRP